MQTRRRARALGALILAVAGTVTACSSGDDDAPAASTTSTTEVDPEAVVALDGVEATELADGVALTSDTDLDADGYVEREYLVSGVARTFDGPANGPATVASEGNEYATRVLVRMPDDPTDFSGRVVVEPFNTSSGVELDAAWKILRTRLVSDGDAWVGVTERSTSVPNLVADDPTRYGSVSFPTNDLAWDVLSQVGALARSDRPGIFPDLDVEHVYLSGYSQSGIEAGTHVSAIGPWARREDGTPVYDGYLVMGRSGSLTPLRSGQSGAPAFEHLPLRPGDVPTIEFQTETDVKGFSEGYTSPSGASVRGDDGDTYRLYEIPGAAHTTIDSCDGEPTTFPMDSFARAAYVNLVDWVENDTSPPRADPIATSSTGTVAEIERDDRNNARGGVRSPFVDVPLATYAPNDTPGVICQLSGSEALFDAATARDLYGSKEDYLDEFETALDETIDTGFLLPDDKDALLTEAERRATEVFS